MPPVTELSYEHKNKIVEIIVDEALEYPSGPQLYFVNLVRQSNLPKQWKIQRQGGWTGDPSFNARTLIDWALAKGGNPSDERYTTLGTFLHVLLPNLGLENRRWIAAIIFGYKLIRDHNLNNFLATRYGIPLFVTDADTESFDFGPDIDWQGPRDKLELQGWFTHEPEFYDVGFLMNAMRRASSVCSIEFNKSKRTGTGFLISKNLVLTNYHVMRSQDEPETALEDNALDAVLHFGKITQDSSEEAEGITFKLSAERPLVKTSSVDKLDFALLHVEDSIQELQKTTDNQIEPSPFTCEIPYKKMELHILQHPGNATMKLALSGNGVVQVNEDSGIVQYATRTQGGSSGSPCFNDNWEVIALHHAQRSKSIGTIREGIIFRSIYEEIKELL